MLIRIYLYGGVIVVSTCSFFKVGCNSYTQSCIILKMKNYISFDSDGFMK